MAGGCAWQGACVVGGHAWLGACVAWVVHGREACMAGVCAWQGGCACREACTAGEACVVGGICGKEGMCGRGACVVGGCAWQGACVADTTYWNAFLFGGNSTLQITSVANIDPNLVAKVAWFSCQFCSAHSS